MYRLGDCRDTNQGFGDLQEGSYQMLHGQSRARAIMKRPKTALDFYSPERNRHRHAGRVRLYRVLIHVQYMGQYTHTSALQQTWLQ